MAALQQDIALLQLRFNIVLLLTFQVVTMPIQDRKAALEDV